MKLTPWDLVWAVWLAIFLALELPAALHAVPWSTLSTTSWDLEDWWSPVRLMLEAFLAVLLLHICFHLSARALIAVVVIAVVALLFHLLGVNL
jgi:hypothetical protein